MAARCVLLTAISTAAFLGLFILAGSIPFFVQRGSALSEFVIECNLSLSFYPTGKVFTDNARFFLFLTPVAATSILPMEAVDSGTWQSASIATLAAFAFLWLTIHIFHYGLRRYQSSNYVMARA